jgi:FemAB-related protein (PEP-CTERM system-associated)
MSIEVSILENPDPACNAFVKQMPNSKISHLPAWSFAVAESMGLKSFYLTARDGTEIVGILPLAQVRSRLFGNRMISQAFSNYGGLLADSLQAQETLFNRAAELATKLNCESIEFRNIEALPYNLEMRTGKICMHLPLCPDPDEMWKAFDCKVRNQVRKAEKSGITVVSGGLELLNEFYRIYTIRMRQLGTPCYPRKLMYKIMQTFPDNCRIFTAQLNKLTIGVAFTVWFEGFVEIPWAATLVEYNKLCPNNLLYWDIIKYFCINGAKWFDFGRCTVNGPTYNFKKEWAAKPVELYYQYWLAPNTKYNILSPDNSRYAKKVEIWKRLPLWATRLIGPYISRQLP